MFLSTYENKLDKKGRVSVPASFRSYLSNLGYNGVICYPSFNNQSIEAWPQDRIEKISNAIDALSPFEEKKDYFVRVANGLISFYCVKNSPLYLCLM